MRRSLSTMILAVILCLSPIRVFAGDEYTPLGKPEDFKSFVRDGITYYDIYGGATNGRPTINNLENLIKDSIYNNPVNADASSKTPAEYWAGLARGINASNPESFYSYGGHPFKSRFQMNPGQKNSYGNVMEAFTRKDGVKYASSKKGPERLKDVVIQMTGMQTASNLNKEMVQEENSRLDTKEQKEISAVVWAFKSGLFDEMEGACMRLRKAFRNWNLQSLCIREWKKWDEM